MEEDDTTYVKNTREVDFQTGRKLLSLQYSINKYKYVDTVTAYVSRNK